MRECLARIVSLGALCAVVGLVRGDVDSPPADQVRAPGGDILAGSSTVLGSLKKNKAERLGQNPARIGALATQFG